LEFKTSVPQLVSDAAENTEILLGYIVNIKSEAEAKITFLENTINVIKESLRTLTEVSE